MGSFTEPRGDDVLDCVVVGAGVVGLAVARALALAGREVVVLEAADAIGTETSSRNSEVIHAGLYYPQGSLKARLCVSGRQMLYDYCERHGIAHRRCGKLIVATDATQLPILEQIRAKAAANGVEDLMQIDADEARRMEPALWCVGALKSPSSGIIDSHGLMLALQGEAQHHGASFLMGSRVCGAQVLSAGLSIEVADRSGRTRWRARTLINCAGLMAPALAGSIEGLAPAHVPRAHYAKGHYFTLSGRCPFSRLIYPVPEPGGLGVHLTLDLQGRGRFGPDVEWVESIDYDVDAGRAQAFYGEVRRYWPDLEDGALQPAYAGIRPKIAGPATPSLDFRIDGPAAHGVQGLVNLFGIESPGLTASLAIGQWVCDLLGEAGPHRTATPDPTTACLT